VELKVRAVTAPEELGRLPALERLVWGSEDPVPVHLWAAVVHAGGVVLAAHPPGDPDDWWGFAAAFLGRDDDGWYLHSHMVGTLPAHQGQGVGRRLKHAQWRWAEQHGLGRLVWTYDPLQAKNAWFNLHIVGARVRRYVPDYYGVLNDELSGTRPSDRLVVEWRGQPPEPVPPGPWRVIEVPADITRLSREDPEAAQQAVLRVRAAFESALREGRRVVGFQRGDRPGYLVQ
jgi:predicted GNAT superfamily acetyltransferase